MKISFQTSGGDIRLVEISGGVTLMEAAVRNGIDEIAADCGGGMACATCHVYIPEAWRSLTGEAGADESELLDSVPNRQAGSRLSCQIKLVPSLDGLCVELPPASD